MKNIMDKIRNISKNDDEVTPKKTIVFFGFYLVFFLIIFLLLTFNSNKNYLTQEYESSNSKVNNKGLLKKNFVYDYKINVDGVLHDYYGKKYEDTEKFKYNNLDYYRDKNKFLVNKDGKWTSCDNPYVFFEFIDFDSMLKIIQNATFMAKTENADGTILYHYLITSNTINKVLYDKDSDYDEDPDSIDIYTDSSDNITNIHYQLNHFCTHVDNCNNTLDIEMNFEMNGSVKKIDNPAL